MAESKRSVVAPQELRDEVKRMIDKHGAVEAGNLLGISRESVVRVAGGIPVRAGTLVMVEREMKKQTPSKRAGAAR